MEYLFKFVGSEYKILYFILFIQGYSIKVTSSTRVPETVTLRNLIHVNTTEIIIVTPSNGLKRRANIE